jgi:ubiquinone/menaquinone biosynthesis C-methylase UbiE
MSLLVKEAKDYVEETRFGIWFLGTETWHHYVLNQALDDLEAILSPCAKAYPVILDLGSGQGKSLLELSKRFSPEKLIAVDVDPESQHRAANAIAQCSTPIEWHNANAHQLPLADASVDMVFCHQTLHHIVDQQSALAECYRVLKPGGVLLIAESTRAYIHSWIIRLLFRHPMHVQRSAEEFVAMVRDAGFEVKDDQIVTPYHWWSRSDLGALEWFGFPLSKQGEREETLVDFVATKSL